MTVETLRWFGVLFILALAVVPFRVGRYLRERRMHLLTDAALAILFVTVLALWLR